MKTRNIYWDICFFFKLHNKLIMDKLTSEDLSHASYLYHFEHVSGESDLAP